MAEADPPFEEEALIDGDAGTELQSQPINTAELWKQTLEKIVNCVAVLKTTHTRAFDTESAGSSYATGFVVDKKRGIILTNRHVVTNGPVVAEAVFQNREEVRVHPLYFDPVHDFAFLRFNPQHLQFMEVNEIPLAPERAAVGLDVRVVGNDSGEKISILSGTLARLDRDAPYYGHNSYNDFNTFYLQAASGTKGGSSGSPVIDVQGHAVALNAGSKTKAASAFYMPLWRVVRALGLIKECFLSDGSWKAPNIPRGDVQATFLFKGFDEVKRLGLRKETEAEVRKSVGSRCDDGHALFLEGQPTGMLVLDKIVPGGPCDGLFQPGDVLTRVQNKIITDHLSMEIILDDSIAAAATPLSDDNTSHPTTVNIEVERGGKSIIADVRVQDLHAVTPRTFLEVGGGVVHSLSYQQARNNSSKVGTVYVAESGYLLGKAGIPRHAIITALASIETATLDDFIKVLLLLPHGSRVPIEFFTFDARANRKKVILHVNWTWYGVPLYWKRCDSEGVWKSQGLVPIGVEILNKNIQHANNNNNNNNNNKVSLSNAHDEIRISSSIKPLFGILQSKDITPNQTEDNNTDGGNGGGDIDTSDATADITKKSSSSGSIETIKKATTVISRKHSLFDINASTLPIEKAGGDGVTINSDDTRLLLDSIDTIPTAATKSIPTYTSRESRENWRRELESRLRAGLVIVDVEVPLVALSDGIHSRSFYGCGIIAHVSHDIGYVIVDRNTVCISAGDVMISFGAFPAEVPGSIVFLHPTHNFSIVSFDPRQLSSEARRSIQVVEMMPVPSLQRGDEVELVCLTNQGMRIVHRTSLVMNAAVPALMNIAEVPRFRAINEEVIKIDQDFGIAISGVLTNRQGHIKALWCNYSEYIDKNDIEWTGGLSVHVIKPWLQKIIEKRSLEKKGIPKSIPRQSPSIPVYLLDTELEPLLLSKAAHFGLSAEWIAKLMACDPEKRQVLRVRSTLAQSNAKEVLRDGDLILMLNDRVVVSFADVEIVLQQQCVYNDVTAPSIVDALHIDVGHMTTTTTTTTGVDATTTVPPLTTSSKNGLNTIHSTPGTRTGGKRPISTIMDPGDDEMRDGGKRGRSFAADSPSKLTRGEKRRVDPNDVGVANNSNNNEHISAQINTAATTTAATTTAATTTAATTTAATTTAATTTAATTTDGDAKRNREKKVRATIFRDGKILENVSIRLGIEDGIGTRRLIHFCGAQIQTPHRAVRELGYVPLEYTSHPHGGTGGGGDGVFISRWHHGSPSHRYSLYALYWIIEVNGIATPDLDTFVDIVKDIQDGEDVRIKMTNIANLTSKVLTLKTDLRYWPTFELVLGDDGEWHRRVLSRSV